MLDTIVLDDLLGKPDDAESAVDACALGDTALGALTQTPTANYQSQTGKLS